MTRDAERTHTIIAAAYLQACRDHLIACRSLGENRVTPYFEVALALENAYSDTIVPLRRVAGLPSRPDVE